MLYVARIEWIKKHNKCKCVYLFVHDKNPMIDTYKKYGFEYYTEKEKDPNTKWMKRKL